MTANLGGVGGRIERSSNGDVRILPPAAVAASQAPVPNGQLEQPQPVAQVTINVPLSKLNAFMKLVEEWMTDEEWVKRF